eukprot:2144989-Amphidinium_carterae.1
MGVGSGSPCGPCQKETHHDAWSGMRRSTTLEHTSGILEFCGVVDDMDVECLELCGLRCLGVCAY